HLRGVRGMGRTKERGRILHPLAVPPHLSPLGRNESLQRAQERRLARADPPGNDDELAPAYRKTDILNARSSAGVEKGEPLHLQHVEGLVPDRLLNEGRQLSG